VSSAVVVGAGVFGASIAHRLAGDGWEVTLVERDEPGHDGASSGGESRLLRCVHGPDALYTRSARRARELWREIEREAGEPLLEACGVAWFARSEDGWVADAEGVLRAEGVRAERLDAAAAARLYPSLRADDLAFVLLEPDAGVLRAAPAVRALVRAAAARGARLVRGTATPSSDGPVVDGRVLESDVTVWACGPWLASLFGDVVSIRATSQDVLFFAPPGPGWTTADVPAWVDYDGAFYGHGDLDGRGLKACPDLEGGALDLDGPRVVSGGAQERARGLLAARFPAFAGASLKSARACGYELTPDTQFVVAPHPGLSATWLVGGGSGHGFKHGPALAEHVAELLSGASDPEPRFALGPRRADRGLRTAGHRSAI
jgi:glycine/D-amino acid oxidase-like deaminating enzyme